MTFSFSSATRVAVIGAGSMGAGIAQLAAQAGHEVRLYDQQPGAAARALDRIGADLAGAVQKGRLTASARDEVLGRLRAADTLAALEGSGLVVEAIVERLEPKQALFRELESLLGDDAVFATNTSSISVTAIAQGLRRPGRLIGWHFFNPATRMKLVEVVCGLATDAALVPAFHALSQAWGKTAVDAPNTPGFIVNRVARPFYAEGLRLLAERIAPLAAIDRLAREAGGFAMGPFELMDLIGVEVNLSVTESVFQATAFDPRFAPHVLQQEMARSGRHGRKSGQGFYDYRDGAAAPQVAAVAPAAAAPLLRVPADANDAGLLAPLVLRLREAGVALEPDASLPRETLALAGVHIALTDGRTAAQRSAEAGGQPLLLLDLALDFARTPLLGAATSAQAVPSLAALAAVLQPAGIALLALDDVAGLVVMRLVACLANEAADLMTWTPTTAADIDTAMRLGVNYPAGPLGWADAIGPARVAQVLQHLQHHYGDVRYRRAPLLTRLQHEEGRFHG
jgi:3-hydroxybutyryl-CoA dehydrogenase